jgi:hypothetical protein
VFAIGRNTRKVAVLLGGLVVLGVSSPVSGGAGANDGLPIGRKPVKLDPADFTVKIDNPYYPLRPGDRRVYRETAPDGTRQRIVDLVTAKTKLIANGVTARVIRATVTNRVGKVVEYTEEWFAQDRAGNVWYFGEDTTKYENGKASKKGSFEPASTARSRAFRCRQSRRRACGTASKAAIRPARQITPRC